MVLKMELGPLYVGLRQFRKTLFGGVADLETASEAVFKKCVEGRGDHLSGQRITSRPRIGVRIEALETLVPCQTVQINLGPRRFAVWEELGTLFCLNVVIHPKRLLLISRFVNTRGVTYASS